MWKRLNNRPHSPRSVDIGNPTLIETSLDEDSAAKLTDLYPNKATIHPNDEFDLLTSTTSQDRRNQGEIIGLGYVVALLWISMPQCRTSREHNFVDWADFFDIS